MGYKALSLPEKWIIKGIPILFLIGGLMHFLFSLSGESLIVGIFAPSNESVWEHMKMVVLPVICWWTAYYKIAGSKYEIDKNRWFTGALAALLTALITVPMLYYFYTGAFGKEILAVDIVILFLALLFGQLLGLHFYRYSKGISSLVVTCIFIDIVIIFIILTIYPSNFPLFEDTSTGPIWID